jgi:hypothetical protein
MLEPRDQRDLALKARHRDFGRHVGRENLEHDATLQRGLYGEKHARHSAATELTLYGDSRAKAGLQLVSKGQEIHREVHLKLCTARHGRHPGSDGTERVAVQLRC